MKTNDIRYLFHSFVQHSFVPSFILSLRRHQCALELFPPVEDNITAFILSVIPSITHSFHPLFILFFPLSLSAGINVPRKRFLPVKTTSDLLLVMSDLYLLRAGSLEMSPKRFFPSVPLVKLGTSFKKVRVWYACGVCGGRGSLPAAGWVPGDEPQAILSQRAPRQAGDLLQEGVCVCVWYACVCGVALKKR